MDCHRCENLIYSGCRYGRCSHPGHRDVILRIGNGAKRPYNRQICADFVMKKRCSNCKYWIRGRYFADGITPRKEGKCSLDILYTGGKACSLWGAGPTSSRKRKEKKNDSKENN